MASFENGNVTHVYFHQWSNKSASRVDGRLKVALSAKIAIRCHARERSRTLDSCVIIFQRDNVLRLETHINLIKDELRRMSSQ